MSGNFAFKAILFFWVKLQKTIAANPLWHWILSYEQIDTGGGYKTWQEMRKMKTDYSENGRTNFIIYLFLKQKQS